MTTGDNNYSQLIRNE